MLHELFCQLLHGRWARVVSYSRQGAWECTKRGCRAQAQRDTPLRHIQLSVIPIRADEQRHAA